MLTRSGRTPPRPASLRRQTIGGNPSDAPPPRLGVLNKNIKRTTVAAGGGGRRQSILPIPGAAGQVASSKPSAARRQSVGGVPYNIPPKSIQQRAGGKTASTGGGEPPRRQSILPVASGHENDNNSSLPPSRAIADANASRRRSRGRQSLLPRAAPGGRENQQPPGTPLNRLLAPTAASRRRSVGGADLADAIQRRKSVGGGGNGPHQTPGKPRRGVQDTRPITDPGFKREAAQLVLKYLKDHDYPLSANLRTLLEPSGTEFASIVAFLMQQFDPSFQNHSGENCMAVSARFEDEVAMYFKFLGYPHTLSKTGMASAGSPHSWPPLLAALSWLVLVLRATEEEPDVDYLRDDPDRCNPFPQVALTQDELSNFTDKGFSQFSHDSYLFDKQKRPDLKDRVLDEFDVAIARGDELAARELEYLMLELEAVAEAVQKDRAFILEIQRMIDERDEKAEWIKDYETKTAPDHEKIMARLTKDIQDKNERLNRFNAAIRELQAKIQDVRLKVSHQTLTTQDDLKLSNRIKGLSEAIERAETQKGTVQSELDIARQELRELKRECIKTLHESFQSKLSQLEDKLPAELRAVNKISHWKKLSADDLVGDGGGAILEEIKSLGVQGKTVLENHLDSLRNKHQDVLDRLEQSVQALKESGAKKQYWYDKSDKARAVLKQETAAHRSKLEVRHIETARLEERVAHLQDPTAFEAQRVAIERRRDDLRSELAECQAKAPEWIRSVGRDIERAIDCMENLDAFFEAEVRELENYNRSMLASAATVHHPPGWKPYHLRSRAGSSSENAAIAVAPDGTDIGGAGERSARNSANDDSASLGTTRSNTKKKSSTSTGGGKKEIRRSSRRKSRL